MKRVIRAPGEGEAFKKCKEQSCLVYIDKKGSAQASPFLSKTSKSVLSYYPQRVVGFYDERISIISLRADIYFILKDLNDA